MNFFRTFMRWVGLYLIVILTIAGCFWQESLPVSLVDHSIFLIGLMVILVFVIDGWVNHHPENFLVSPDHLDKKQKEFEQEIKNARMEK